MKPTPRPRRTVPKATGPDPAAPRTTSPEAVVDNARNTIKARNTGNTRKAGNAGRADKVKVSLYLPRDLVEEARTAWISEWSPDGCPNFSAWVARAVEAELRRARGDAGHPLEPTPAGRIPTGRPTTAQKDPAREK